MFSDAMADLVNYYCDLKALVIIIIIIIIQHMNGDPARVIASE